MQYIYQIHAVHLSDSCSTFIRFMQYIYQIQYIVFIRFMQYIYQITIHTLY